MNQTYNITIEPSYEKFYNSTSDFGVYACRLIESIPKINTNDKDHNDFTLLTITGNTPKLIIGKQYKSIVLETVHPKYGQSFKIQSIFAPELSSQEEEQYFLSTMCTELQCKNILTKYPMPVTAILDDKFDYTKVKRFNSAQYNKLKKAVLEGHKYMKALTILGQFGISYGQTKKIVNAYPSVDLAIKAVTENPYILYHTVSGIGFTKADQIAKAMGITSDDIRRINAALVYGLECNENSGNTWIQTNKLLEDTEAILELEFEDINDLKDIIKKNKYCWISDDESIVAISSTRKCEQDIVDELRRINSYQVTPFFLEDKVTEHIKSLEQQLGIKYADMQKQLFYQLNSSKITVLTGYAGTGKTSTLNGCLKMIDSKHGIICELLSPTAKAAIVLKRATKRNASTIHKALGWTPTGFRYNEHEPLPIDILIVDEASMVDIFLFRNLLKAIPDKCRLLLIGDPAQLESIQTGSVLNDIINSRVYPVVALDVVFRQALDSGIINAATNIWQGINFLKGSDEILELGLAKDFKIWFGEKENSANRILKIFKQLIGKYSIEDIMVISPMKNGVSGVKLLNNLLQEAYNPSSEEKNQIDMRRCVFREGDKVIHLKNYYEAQWYDSSYEEVNGKGVINGDTGIIKKININDNDGKPTNEMFVDYGDRLIKYENGMFDMIDLSYANTVHKAQGSQAKVVIMAIDTSHYIMLKRSLLYTGVTRASEKCFIIGDKKAIGIAISNNAIDKKKTFLESFLKTLDNCSI